MNLQRKKATINCKICEKTFTAQEGAKYCSRPCKLQAHREAQKRFQAKKRKLKTFSPKGCIVCSQEIQPRSFVHKYCSNECRQKHRLSARSRNRASDREKDDPYIHCAVCQKPFKQSWPRHTAVTCSAKCSRSYSNKNYQRQKTKFIEDLGYELWQVKVKTRNDRYKAKLSTRMI